MRFSGLWIAYWIWFGCATAALMLTESSVRAQPILVVLALAIVHYGTQLQKLLSKIKLGPPWCRFCLYSLIWCLIIAENLFINLRGDLHSNLAINTFLWLGSIMAYMLAWWHLCSQYDWTVQDVFLFSGINGLFLEQIFLVPRLILQGQVLAAVIMIPFLHALYGALAAPVYALMQPYLRKNRNPPSWKVKLFATIYPQILFWVGSLWIPLWTNVLHLPS